MTFEKRGAIRLGPKSVTEECSFLRTKPPAFPSYCNETGAAPSGVAVDCMKRDERFTIIQRPSPQSPERIMTFRRPTLSLAVSLVACLCAGAGEFNQVLDIGDPAPKWEKLPSTDGEPHSAEMLKDSPATVVVFTCNSCPYAQDIEERLVALQKKLAGQEVPIVAINVNKIDEDRLPAMKEKAAQAGFDFPYLFDESQQIAKEFGAIKTPEFYVLDSDWRVVYMGALDDSPDGKNVTQRYVEPAVEAVLEGKEPEVTETVPIGCGIRYERERRSRRSR